MIENPRTGEQIEFEIRTPELLVMHSVWTRPGHRAAEHLHPEIEERFEVNRGARGVPNKRRRANRRCRRGRDRCARYAASGLEPHRRASATHDHHAARASLGGVHGATVRWRARR